MAVTAYVGLGANLGNPVEQLTGAVQAIARIPKTELFAVSKLYASRPVGPGEQEDYCNAAVALSTELEPEKLLDELQRIELEFGRERLIRWGSRTLDLDILLFGDSTINTERLIVPHKEMHWRSFVLHPLADITQPGFTMPDGTSLQSLLDDCDSSGLNLPGKNWKPLT
ncbi:2-amino-4-hydroxy-6-hydroxymethyldihydropteridine diphosphokinase [Spongorhabdus nitratireducens]